MVRYLVEKSGPIVRGTFLILNKHLISMHQALCQDPGLVLVDAMLCNESYRHQNFLEVARMTLVEKKVE